MKEFRRLETTPKRTCPHGPHPRATAAGRPFVVIFLPRVFFHGNPVPGSFGGRCMRPCECDDPVPPPARPSRTAAGQRLAAVRVGAVWVGRGRAGQRAGFPSR